jgi:nicotinate-nucleotide--dimethylbenzimidazole phosphoribosyltransferase
LQRLPAGLSPLELLRRAGGREIVALYGAMRCALERRKLVLVDGFIVTAVAAALAATDPAALGGMIFSHCSAEQGHRGLLDHLGVSPLLQLDMRLGEASGALTALPLLRSACALHNQMATFESARIPGAQ